MKPHVTTDQVPKYEFILDGPEQGGMIGKVAVIPGICKPLRTCSLVNSDQEHNTLDTSGKCRYR